MEFRFSNDWNQVWIVKKYQTDVIDRLVDEWCEFDDAKDIDNPAIPIQITENKTFDWYLSNQIQSMKARFGDQREGLLALGNGVLYNGGLTDASCRLTIVNEMYGGNAITRGVLKKTLPGSTEVYE